MSPLKQPAASLPLCKISCMHNRLSGLELALRGSGFAGHPVALQMTGTMSMSVSLLAR